MNRTPIIFISTLIAFALSFGAFVLAPQLQVGGQGLTKVVGSEAAYPVARAGTAVQGAEVYRAEGCVACHSQQIRQSGVVFDVALKEAGTNEPALIAVLKKLDPKLDDAAAKALAGAVPQLCLSGLATKAEADAAKAALEAVGEVKAQIRLRPTGADIARNWGLRRSVAADYLYDSPVLLGAQRIGPDLSNVGARRPDAGWQLRHLYAPRAEIKDSTMPPYKYLFETRKVGHAPSPDALQLPAGFEPPAGYEVVPTDRARELVAYLRSLRVDAPLYEAPLAGPLALPKPDATNNAVAQ